MTWSGRLNFTIVPQWCLMATLPNTSFSPTVTSNMQFDGSGARVAFLCSGQPSRKPPVRADDLDAFSGSRGMSPGDKMNGRMVENRIER